MPRRYRLGLLEVGWTKKNFGSMSPSRTWLGLALHNPRQRDAKATEPWFIVDLYFSSSPSAPPHTALYRAHDVELESFNLWVTHQIAVLSNE
jgi:hypothetical protein